MSGEEMSAGPCPNCRSSEQDYGPGSECSRCHFWANPPADAPTREEIADAAGVPLRQVHLRPGFQGRTVVDLHDYGREETP